MNCVIRLVIGSGFRVSGDISMFTDCPFSTTVHGGNMFFEKIHGYGFGFFT